MCRRQFGSGEVLDPDGVLAGEEFDVEGGVFADTSVGGFTVDGDELDGFVAANAQDGEFGARLGRTGIGGENEDGAAASAERECAEDREHGSPRQD